MAEKKVKRIVISRDSVKKTDQGTKRFDTGSSRVIRSGIGNEEGDLQKTDSPREVGRPRRVCFFCQGKKGTATNRPSYTDISVLRRFITDRVKIVPRAKSSLCSKHQRAVCKQIKYARHLSLLPFVPKV